MGFKFVLLWTDAVLWLLVAGAFTYAVRLRHRPDQRATWMKVLRDPAALSAGLVLLLFIGVAMLDSVHFRRALAPTAGAPASTQTFYATSTESLLDLPKTLRDGLPAAARHYLQRLEVITGVPVDMISTGADRDNNIILRHPFD